MRRQRLVCDVRSGRACVRQDSPASAKIVCFCFAGKVHGSLARAGKVRGQTPKVPKQEKKKKPTGRAMKRIKYNRRFVNVGERLWALMGPGRGAGRRHRAVLLHAAGRSSCMLPVLLYRKLDLSVFDHGMRTSGAAMLALMEPSLLVPCCCCTQRQGAHTAVLPPPILVCIAVVGFGKKKGPNSQ